MDAKINHSPSFSTLFVDLKKRDRITAEADAMASMTSNVTFDTHTMGGIFSALFRKIGGGESIFVNDFYLEEGENGEVVLTQNLPGDLVCMELKNGQSIYLQPGAFLACTQGIKIQTKWAGFKSWFSKEGLFRLQAIGDGKVWFGGFGGIVEKQVKGEYIVDTAHLIAYDPSLNMNLQLSGDGLLSSLFSGEGFVMRLEGNGVVYLQTRTIEGLAGWINPRLH